MTGRQLVEVVTLGVVALGVLRVAVRLSRARRLLATTPPEDRAGPRRVLDALTAVYAGVLAAGVVVGTVAHSVAWGIGTVVVLSVAAMLAMVVGMLVAASGGGARR
jgi:hypothetical protein